MPSAGSRHTDRLWVFHRSIHRIDEYTEGVEPKLSTGRLARTIFTAYLFMAIVWVRSYACQRASVYSVRRLYVPSVHDKLATLTQLLKLPTTAMVVPTSLGPVFAMGR